MIFEQLVRIVIVTINYNHYHSYHNIMVESVVMLGVDRLSYPYPNS